LKILATGITDSRVPTQAATSPWVKQFLASV